MTSISKLLEMIASKTNFVNYTCDGVNSGHQTLNDAKVVMNNLQFDARTSQVPYKLITRVMLTQTQKH